jgi:hypothetical protein
LVIRQAASRSSGSKGGAILHKTVKRDRNFWPPTADFGLKDTLVEWI